MDRGLSHLSANDPTMADLIGSYAPPSFKKHTNYYPELIRSIISQQLSIKAAATIQDRFKQLFFDEFPTPEQLLYTEVEVLREAGLSKQKVGYMQNLAQFIISGSINLETLDEHSNDQIIEILTRVKGIGVWTVHMFLMFCMGRPDVLPVGDLGIRNGVKKLYGFTTTPGPDDIQQIASANNWHPYESIASWYVWQSLNNAPNIVDNKTAKNG